VDAEQFRLMRWDAELADAGGYEHVCSESCAARALSKWLAQASGNVVYAVSVAGAVRVI
jgi:hypothetical protein